MQCTAMPGSDGPSPRLARRKDAALPLALCAASLCPPCWTAGCGLSLFLFVLIWKDHQLE